MTKEEGTLKTRLWIVNGILGFVMTIGIVLIPLVANQMIGTMKELNTSIKCLSESMAQQQIINKNHNQKDQEQDRKLEKHESRIHNLEIKR